MWHLSLVQELSEKKKKKNCLESLKRSQGLPSLWIAMLMAATLSDIMDDINSGPVECPAS